MKNQKGFTLVELMVVMAIIAIMATAGITQYSGFIKTARDNTRIQDLKAIETFIVKDMASTSTAPAAATFNAKLKEFAGKTFKDPSSGATSCLKADASAGACKYEYATCDGGGGYVIRAQFEDKSKVNLYATDEYGGVDPSADHYEVGNCSNAYPVAGDFIEIDGEDAAA